MNNPDKSFDAWSLPLMAAWALFFVMGLFPSMLFYYLRDIGHVAMHYALVNSPHAVTAAFAVYLGFFTFQRCLDVGLSRADAQRRGLLVCLLGFLAFLDYPLESLFVAPAELAQSVRWRLYLAGLAKLTAWFYLYISILRYYALGNQRVFADMIPTHQGTPPAESGNPKGNEGSSSPVAQEAPEPDCRK